MTRAKRFVATGWQLSKRLSVRLGAPRRLCAMGNYRHVFLGRGEDTAFGIGRPVAT